MDPLNFQDVLLFSSNILLSVINFIIGLKFFKSLLLSRKKFHINHVVIRFHHFICCISLNFFIAMIAAIPLFSNEKNISLFTSYLYFIYRVCGIGISTISIMLRLVTIAIFVERTFATACNATYENKFSKLGFFVCFSACLISAMMASAYHAKLYSFYTYVGCVMIIDIVTIISAIVLVRQNKRLRKITTTCSNIKLTQRYQINENLQILLMIQPMIITEAFLNIFASASGPFAIWIDGNMFYANYVYYTINNFNVFCIFIISLKMSKAFGPLSWKRLQRESQTATSNNNNHVRINNVFGEQINCHQSQMEYFNTLKKEWA